MIHACPIFPVFFVFTERSVNTNADSAFSYSTQPVLRAPALWFRPAWAGPSPIRFDIMHNNQSLFL
jgi:hypothetical protein